MGQFRQLSAEILETGRLKTMNMLDIEALAISTQDGPVRLFSDQQGLPDYAPPAILLLPWWTPRFQDKSEFRDMGRYDRYLREAHHYFAYTSSINESDFAVLPSDWKHYFRRGDIDPALQFAHKVRDVGRSLIVQFYADEECPIPIDDAIIFRTSFPRSNAHSNEYAMPGFVGDPISVLCNGDFQARSKQLKPVVSFCGWASQTFSPLKENFGSFVHNCFEGLNIELKYQLIYDFRMRILEHLMAYKSIETIVIPRNGYCANIDRQWDLAGLRRIRQEYFQSIFDSDYVLCVRGKGNYSYRFYETLAAGRIPVFVNTDSPLPLSDIIDWKNHCVWVEHEDIMNIGEIILTFHESLSESDFKAIQQQNRLLWERLLTPEKFFIIALKIISAGSKPVYNNG